MVELKTLNIKYLENIPEKFEKKAVRHKVTYMFWGVDGGGSISWQPSSGIDFIATPFSPSDGKDSPKDAEAE